MQSSVIVALRYGFLQQKAACLAAAAAARALRAIWAFELPRTRACGKGRPDQGCVRKVAARRHAGWRSKVVARRGDTRRAWCIVMPRMYRSAHNMHQHFVCMP